MLLTDRLQNSLDRLDRLLVKFNENHDESGRFVEGDSSSGGGSATSPGEKESYSDRIEGTQKEVDREVIRYAKKADQARTALKEAVAKQILSVGVVSKLNQALRSVEDRKQQIDVKLNASNQRVAELRAKLDALKKRKSEEAELMDVLEKQFELIKSYLGELMSLTKDLEVIIQEIMG
jgi:chromosome segregation ATPase